MADPESKADYQLAFEDAFDNDVLDEAPWFPHHLPQWSSREASAARYEVGGGLLRLILEADQEPWCPEFDGGTRVSSLQTGVFAGPVGSTVGQHPVAVADHHRGQRTLAHLSSGAPMTAASRYEALRAYLHEGLPDAEAADRLGYRGARHSVYEIAAVLAHTATPLNRTRWRRSVPRRASRGCGPPGGRPRRPAPGDPAPRRDPRLRRPACPRRDPAGRAAADHPRPVRPGPARHDRRGRYPSPRRSPPSPTCCRCSPTSTTWPPTPARPATPGC